MAAHIFSSNLSTVSTADLNDTRRVLTDVGIPTLTSLLLDLYIGLNNEIEHRVDQLHDAFHVMSDSGIEPPSELIELYAGLTMHTNTKAQ